MSGPSLPPAGPQPGQQPTIGFQPLPSQPVYPPMHQHPGYPAVQKQPGYPGPQPTYPAYPQQPFPPPMQQPGGYGQPQAFNWASSNLMNHIMSSTSFNVVQKVELLEAITGWETGNKYSVKDQSGNKIFYVGEVSSCMSRICCGQYRPFTLEVKDNLGQTVMNFSRGVDCGRPFCGYCCGDQVKATTPSGQILGYIEEEGSLCYPRFRINNANGNAVFKLEGPVCICGTVSFQVLDLNENPVGSIQKVWGGVVRELFTDADTFSVSFPVQADAAAKVTLLGALFMIDFHYFERSGLCGGEHESRKFFC